MGDPEAPAGAAAWGSHPLKRDLSSLVPQRHHSVRDPGCGGRWGTNSGLATHINNHPDQIRNPQGSESLEERGKREEERGGGGWKSGGNEYQMANEEHEEEERDPEKENEEAYGENGA
eukprot:8503569-Pyramimonas_sp.AAC.1